LSALMSPIFDTLYQGFEIDADGLDLVRQTAKTHRIVIVPSHKSHMDYLIISNVFYQHGLMPPHIAAGVPPADIGGVSRLPQNGHGDAVDEERAPLFIHNPDHPFRIDAAQEPVDGPIGRILFDHLSDGGKSGANPTANIDDDFLKIFSGDMVPERKLPYSPQAVDAENRSPVLKNFHLTHTPSSFLFLKQLRILLS